MSGKRIVALVYAGGPGALLPWRGKTVIHHVVDAASSWPVERVVVVLGEDGEATLDAGDFGDATVVLVTEWAEGSASLVRAGLDALVRDGAVDAAVLLSGDLVDADPKVVSGLVEAYERSHSGLTVPKYRYAIGAPIVVAESMWSDLMNQEGRLDVVAFARSRAEAVDECWFDQLGPTRIIEASDLASVRG